MTLYMLVLILILIGVLIWAARRFITDLLLRKIAVIVLVIAGIYIALDAIGVLAVLKSLAVPKV